MRFTIETIKKPKNEIKLKPDEITSKNISLEEIENGWLIKFDISGTSKKDGYTFIVKTYYLKEKPKDLENFIKDLENIKSEKDVE